MAPIIKTRRSPTSSPPTVASPLLRILLFGIGVLATGLGVLGIFLPLLPTVPLLLLAAACFARSSPRCYAWLLDHPRLGPLVSDYLDGNGIPLRAKVWAILLLWTSISLSTLLLAPILPVKLTLFAVAIGVTIYLLRLPTRNEG
ncbi:MAG: YbaN family protein [Desulfuromonadales bacterium]|nr:YbaN family protein [Desulfuromonadales bacterium]